MSSREELTNDIQELIVESSVEHPEASTNSSRVNKWLEQFQFVNSLQKSPSEGHAVIPGGEHSDCDC